MTPGRSGGADGSVPIRPASTVMVVRDSAAGVEVFTLRRAATLVFAAGMTVFPGGGVDPRDAEPSVPWTGPDPAWWAERWHVPVDHARSQVVAAVRELYEETGLLLAGPGGDAQALPTTIRADLAGHRTGLAEVLRERSWQLRADLLRPWSRWITPPGPPRRYDTYFFLAALPEGQQADHDTSEAIAGAWQRPGDVLTAGSRGEVGLLPPTVATLTDLADAATVTELLAAQRPVEPILPELITADGEVLGVRVGEREYRTSLIPSAE